MATHSDPTANAAIGAVNREMRQMVRRAVSIRKTNRKLTPEELKAVEDLVNEQIQRHMPITCEEMTVAEAKAQGAIGLFESKYGERVRMYTMGPYSKEICGGPHAENTGDLGHFVIKKEEASSSGVRRIKAILEK